MGKRKDPSVHLHLVDTPADYSTGEGVPAPTPTGEGTGGAAQWMANALMYQAVSWVALFKERVCASVDIAPIGGPLYEADVTLEDGDKVLLRIRCEVAMGRVVVARVEPARP